MTTWTLQLADLDATRDDDDDGPPDGPATGRSDWKAYRAAAGSPASPYKRAAVVRLRDARLIDDIVLRGVEARLDAEELRLTTPVDPD